MVRISAIALDTLLELVGRQVIHELGEDCLSSIHPSFSAICTASGHPALAPVLPINFKSKNESYTLSRATCDCYSERPDFSRTLVKLKRAALSAQLGIPKCDLRTAASSH